MNSDALDKEHGRLNAAGEIAAIIFHDLRSPLSIIKGYIDMLAMKEGDVPKEKLKEISAVLAQQIEIINQMAVDSACFRESAPTVKRPIAAQRILDTIAHAAPAVVITAKSSAVVHVEPSLIERALLGIVRVLASAENTVVHVGTAEAAGYFRFVLSAAGISTDANMDKMFSPMFIYGKRRGAGLALMCAKKTALDHGGDITAEKQNGDIVITMLIPLESTPSNRG